MSQLVLSLFPGADLLGLAFEMEGFCVVQGPDLKWGRDVRDALNSVAASSAGKEP